MENGTFQASLPEMNFQEYNREPTSNTRRVSSVQSLLQQNEEISIRLKLAISKLAELEDQNESLLAEQNLFQNSIQALNEQLFIWKEKERLWQEKLHKAEFQYLELQKSVPDLERLTHELSRYQRYHEKVKTQIKPYIHQLKDYAKGLSEHIKSLNVDLDRRDFTNQLLEKKNLELETELALQLQTNAKIQEDQQAYFQSEMGLLRKENTHLRERVLISERKADQLDVTLERQDELVNQTIVLKRSLDEIRDQQTHESEGLRKSLAIARNEILQLSTMLENVQNQNSCLETQLQQHQEQTEQLQDQLTGIRFLWSEQNENMEKLKQSNHSLEKINSELSLKLRESRLALPG